MKHEIMEFKDIKLVGISERTNNAHEMNPETAKIGQCLHRYFSRALNAKITERKNPGKTFCVYTDYASDMTGDYTYFIGEEVTSFADLPEGCVALTIPAQTYSKFTTGPGAMPQVCIQLWQKIWGMTPDELSGTRVYRADFEVYDERAIDPHNTILDIYIGIER